MNADVSLERARLLLRYDPKTGHLYWLVNVGKARVGNRAGSINSDGYRRVSIDGISYPAHRLAWFIHFGRWPVDELDHENGLTDDNRIDNLREATTSVNSRNRSLRVDNSTGAPGVYLHKQSNRWYAQSCHGGKNKHIGNFGSFDEAVAARRQFQEQHGYHINHGRR